MIAAAHEHSGLHLAWMGFALPSLAVVDCSDCAWRLGAE